MGAAIPRQATRDVAKLTSYRSLIWVNVPNRHFCRAVCSVVVLAVVCSDHSTIRPIAS